MYEAKAQLSNVEDLVMQWFAGLEQLVVLNLFESAENGPVLADVHCGLQQVAVRRDARVMAVTSPGECCLHRVTGDGVLIARGRRRTANGDVWL